MEEGVKVKVKEHNEGRKAEEGRKEGRRKKEARKDLGRGAKDVDDEGQLVDAILALPR